MAGVGGQEEERASGLWQPRCQLSHTSFCHKCCPCLPPPAALLPARPQARQSYVSIPGLQYGQAGRFAVVFWAQPQLESGASLDYAYSHTNARNTQFAFDPNEVRTWDALALHCIGGGRAACACSATGRLKPHQLQCRQMHRQHANILPPSPLPLPLWRRWPSTCRSASTPTMEWCERWCGMQMTFAPTAAPPSILTPMAACRQTPLAPPTPAPAG